MELLTVHAWGMAGDSKQKFNCSKSIFSKQIYNSTDERYEPGPQLSLNCFHSVGEKQKCRNLCD